MKKGKKAHKRKSTSETLGEPNATAFCHFISAGFKLQNIATCGFFVYLN